MTVTSTKEQGGFGYVTCKSELPPFMGIVRLFDHVPAEVSHRIAEQHDIDTGGTRDITSGRHRLIPLDPELMRKAQALQKARMHREAYNGWRPRSSTQS